MPEDASPTRAAALRSSFDEQSRRAACHGPADRILTAVTYLRATRITVVTKRQLLRALPPPLAVRDPVVIDANVRHTAFAGRSGTIERFCDRIPDHAFVRLGELQCVFPVSWLRRAGE